MVAGQTNPNRASGDYLRSIGQRGAQVLIRDTQRLGAMGRYVSTIDNRDLP